MFLDFSFFLLRPFGQFLSGPALSRQSIGLQRCAGLLVVQGVRASTRARASTGVWASVKASAGTSDLAGRFAVVAIIAIAVVATTAIVAVVVATATATAAAAAALLVVVVGVLVVVVAAVGAVVVMIEIDARVVSRCEQATLRQQPLESQLLL